MKLVVVLVVAAALNAGTVVAQQRTKTVNRNDFYTYRNRTAENLGYAGMGLTAFLALLDSVPEPASQACRCRATHRTQDRDLAVRGVPMAAWW
ncbi:MAG: hypothetical protein ACRDUX_38840 [Mycobacterium sp.]